MSGIEDKEVWEQVQKLVEEKYSDRMYQYYTGIADSGARNQRLPCLVSQRETKNKCDKISLYQGAD